MVTYNALVAGSVKYTCQSFITLKVALAVSILFGNTAAVSSWSEWYWALRRVFKVGLERREVCWINLWDNILLIFFWWKEKENDDRFEKNNYSFGTFGFSHDFMPLFSSHTKNCGGILKHTVSLVFQLTKVALKFTCLSAQSSPKSVLTNGLNFPCVLKIRLCYHWSS